MQARSLMTSALPERGTGRRTLRPAAQAGVKSRMARRHHRSVVLSARVAEVRDAHTYRYDVANRGRRW